MVPKMIATFSAPDNAGNQTEFALKPYKNRGKYRTEHPNALMAANQDKGCMTLGELACLVKQKHSVWMKSDCGTIERLVSSDKIRVIS